MRSIWESVFSDSFYLFNLLFLYLLWIYINVLCKRMPADAHWEISPQPLSLFKKNLVSYVFSSLYSMSPELSDCWRWEKMKSLKREASSFGLGLTGNDEKHMGHEKVQSNFVFTKLSVSFNICHQVRPKGAPIAGPWWHIQSLFSRVHCWLE